MSNNNNNKTSDNNWLGFSLSPHLPETSPSNPTTFFNYQNIYYGGVDGGIFSAFPIMPLKSDGSLGLMDSITKSQGKGFFFFFMCCLKWLVIVCFFF